MDEKVFGCLRFDDEASPILKPLLKKFGVVPAFRSKKLKTFLRSPKDQTAAIDKSGIYKISCQPGCDEKYIGQSRRIVGVRLKEHTLHFRNKEPDRSAVARHLLEKQHLLGNGCLELVRNVTEPGKLFLWESLEIHRARQSNALMNVDVPLCSSLCGLLF